MALKIGILGAARIAPWAIIFPSQVIPTTNCVAIAARDRSRAEVFAATHNIPRVYDSYADVVADPEIDLIYNPLPIHLHAEWSIKALETGKHVLCEKPFAMNIDEANAMQTAAKNNGKRIIEAFHHRYHPAHIALLNWAQSGKIGDVRKIQAVFNVHIKDDGQEIRHRVETGGGAMMDLGCYPLNWVLNVLDQSPIKVEAEATLTPAGVDETMVADLYFENGAVAKISTMMSEGTERMMQLHVIGESGSITFENPVAPHLRGKLSCSDGSIAEVSPISTYTHQLAAIASSLRSGAELPTEGNSITRQQKVLDEIYIAAGLRHLRFFSS